MRTYLATTLLVLVAAAPAYAKTAAETLQDKQQAACYDDAQRLCPDQFPDVDAVKTCMAGRKSQVSAACQAFYPADAK